jgi:hypothetical protein
MPWVAAYNTKVDVVYYGTTASSNTDTSAVWNTYDAQSTNGSAFQQIKVSNTPNHTGEICLEGDACPNQDMTRTLLDLFEVAENPVTGKASIAYVDDSFHTWSDNGPAAGARTCPGELGSCTRCRGQCFSALAATP